MRGVRRGPQGGRPVGWRRGSRHGHALHRGQPAARLLHDEGRHRGVRQPAHPTRSARRRCSRVHVLARVQSSGQGGDPRSLAALPQGRPAGGGRRPHARQVLAWDPIVDALAAQAPVWEPGTAHGYHARHLRVAGRRGRSPREREERRHVLRRGDRRAARPRVLDRAARRAAAPRGSPRHLEHAEGPGHGRAHRAVHGPRDAARQGPRWSGRHLHAASRACSTAPMSVPPRSLPPTVSPTPDRWPASTPGWRARSRAVRRSRSSRPTRPRPPPPARRPAPTRCSTSRRPSASASSPPPRWPATAAASSFGHTGAGGSVGFTDPANEIGFGYVMNRMMQGLTGDPR